MKSKKVNQIKKIYKKLYMFYGPQGWWPLMDCKNKGSNPTKKGSFMGYHPNNYDLPKTREQVYEVIVGTILTQNTSWTSAEKALLNLNELGAIKPEKLLKLDDDTLKKAIKPAGFMNQKAIYLREISRFFIDLKGKFPKRDELMAVRGVGNETADSILLYAYKQPKFVIDTYTKRIFAHLKLVDENIGYMELKELFESNLPGDVAVYQEYHALIVEHAKRYYRRKPYGVDDPLKNL